MSAWGGGGWGETPWGGGIYTPSSASYPTVSIGGVDRPYLVVNSAQMSWPKRGRRTARFVLFDRSQVYVPSLGEPVVLTDGGTSFHGIITKIEEKRPGDDEILDYIFFHCECSDYSAVFDRRFVSRRYPAGSIAKNVILDIVHNWFIEDGFDTANVNGFTTITDELVFDYRSGTECFNTISDLTGEDWWVGGVSGKSVYFRSLAAAPVAPFSITDTSENWRLLSRTLTMTGYRNRQYVRGSGTLQSGAITETFAGDGSTWLFPTQFVLTAAPTVTVNAVPQTVYRMGVDAYPAAGWFWIPGGGGVQQGQQIAPAIGSVISVSYGSYSSTVVMAENTTQQAARAAIEGGSGIWESIEEARDVDNLSTAQELAAGILSRYLTIPSEIVYETDVAGLEPGMAQGVYLRANNIAVDPPVAYWGDELVANGDFASDSGWTVGANWTIGSGVATASFAYTNLSRNIGATAAGTYRIEFDMTRTGGSIFAVSIGSDLTTAFSTSGHKTVDLVVTDGGDGVLSFVGFNLQGTIDNVSVRKQEHDYRVPYYVTQIESRDIGAPFPGSGYFFRHRVTLTSVRDQGSWLAWWMNFYRQSKHTATDTSGVIAYA